MIKKLFLILLLLAITTTASARRIGDTEVVGTLTVGGTSVCLEDGTDCPAAGLGDVTAVGDCASGACLDGTSDGGTWIKFYDAQGAGQLITGDLTDAKVWTLPDATGTVALTTSNVATASALAADPADCGAGTCATAIGANGALTCSITPLTTVDISANTNLAGTANEITLTGDTLSLSATLDLGGKTSLEIPNSADCSTTTGEGQICWDSDGDALYVGNGATSTAVGAGGSFNSTTVDATTWSDGANASNVWTFDVSGTDTTMTFGDGVIGTSAKLGIGTDAPSVPLHIINNQGAVTNAPVEVARKTVSYSGGNASTGLGVKESWYAEAGNGTIYEIGNFNISPGQYDGSTASYYSINLTGTSTAPGTMREAFRLSYLGGTLTSSFGGVTPQALLHLRGGDGLVQIVESYSEGNQGADYGPYIDWWATDNSTTQDQMGRIEATTNGGGVTSTTTSQFIFYNSIAGTLTEGMRITDAGKIRINAGIEFTPSSTTDIAPATGITVTKGIMRVQSNDADDCDITADPQIVDGTDGQVVIIQGDSDTKTVTLADGTGLALAGGASLTLGKGDILSLTYDLGDDIWYELYRSNN